MTTAAPSVPLQLQVGQLVSRRSEPLDTAVVGVVSGLVFVSEPVMAIVRWLGGSWTFELEDALVEHGPGRSPSGCRPWPRR
jgi:hypothetical protein